MSLFKELDLVDLGVMKSPQLTDENVDEFRSLLLEGRNKIYTISLRDVGNRTCMTAFVDFMRELTTDNSWFSGPKQFLNRTHLPGFHQLTEILNVQEVFSLFDLCMDLRDLEINSLKIALTTDNLCGVLRFGDYIFVVMEGINKNMGIRAQNIVDETQIMIEVSSLKHA